MQKPFAGDHSLLKSINLTSLLDLIRRKAPISRAELAKSTRLTRATVSTLVEELIARHLVVETGTGESSGGRRPTMLEINRNAGYIAGVDLRAKDLLVLAVNLQGEPVLKRTEEYERPQDEEHTRKQLTALIGEIRNELPLSPLGLCGVGVGIHGFVGHPGGEILFVPHFGWKRLAWKEALEKEWRVPVWIDNEANLAALGELESGAAADCSDMLYVSVGAGIGGGLILDRNIFRGSHGYAGEIGHTTIERGGRLCTCGNRGCWEMYASEKALAESLGLRYKPGVTAEVTRRLQEGDAEAREAIRDIGGSLAVGIGNLINTFNPQMVVLGNAIAFYRSWLEEVMASSMRSRFPFRSGEAVEIRYSELGEEACARGAAFMGIREMMKRV
ncbi:ROK family transcriptional regulator [Paenibacillus aurantius]|uniref:ROK family transcriptional regulator n=1 Tax=Paenibacillus aurantius TaxID=2918900 RepID=A0AA96LAU9_9BACL|nr:ROK family transcriptional regulator [Paenibacillus aurantius]WNQ09743.1 ROK family transcriptional regulator [Paenibacillus aurantius]